MIAGWVWGGLGQKEKKQKTGVSLIQKLRKLKDE